MTQDFIQKLMISKKIMEKHDQLPRSGNSGGNINIGESITAPDLQSFQPVAGSYSIPEEFLSSNSVVNTKPAMVTEDRIKNSKLPDEIKRLMMEHPIVQPETYSAKLSDDIIEKAAKLMGTNTEKISENQISKKQTPPSVNNSELKKIIKETLEEILKSNGIISESESESNEKFSFRVGKHIFEGKVTKIKKIN
jgi:hypothetical protein